MKRSFLDDVTFEKMALVSSPVTSVFLLIWPLIFTPVDEWNKFKHAELWSDSFCSRVSCLVCSSGSMTCERTANAPRFWSIWQSFAGSWWKLNVWPSTLVTTIILLWVQTARSCGSMTSEWSTITGEKGTEGLFLCQTCPCEWVLPSTLTFCVFCLSSGSLRVRVPRRAFTRSVTSGSPYQTALGSTTWRVSALLAATRWCELKECVCIPQLLPLSVSGHLPVKLPDYNNRLRVLVATYVTFSPDGTELLVNMGGEQVTDPWPVSLIVTNTATRGSSINCVFVYRCIYSTWRLNRGRTHFSCPKSVILHQVNRRVWIDDDLKLVLKYLARRKTRKECELDHVTWLLFTTEVQNGKTTNGMSNGIHLPASRLRLAQVSR